VFYSVSGQQDDGSRPAELLAVLDDVAHAISNVVSIYIHDPDSISGYKALHPIDLLQGHFEEGGMVFVTKKGRQLRGLTVRRRDMYVAISVLKAAKANFVRPFLAPSCVMASPHTRTLDRALEAVGN